MTSVSNSLNPVYQTSGCLSNISGQGPIENDLVHMSLLTKHFVVCPVYSRAYVIHPSYHRSALENKRGSYSKILRKNRQMRNQLDD
jgi:hypothetical protein